MLPFLNRALDLSREHAEFFAPYDHIADPLIDGADQGMTAAAVGALFSELKHELGPIVRAIADQRPGNRVRTHSYSFGDLVRVRLAKCWSAFDAINLPRASVSGANVSNAQNSAW